jgi:hypothetical protein
MDTGSLRHAQHNLSPERELTNDAGKSRTISPGALVIASRSA